MSIKWSNEDESRDINSRAHKGICADKGKQLMIMIPNIKLKNDRQRSCITQSANSKQYGTCGCLQCNTQEVEPNSYGARDQ